MLNIDQLIKDNLKNPIELYVYREIKAAILRFKTAKNAKEYTESEETKLLQKLEKEHLESLDNAKLASREDLISEETNRLEVYRKLLPEAPGYEKMVLFLESSYPQGVEKSSLGKAIKLLKSEFPTGDGKVISEIVKNHLI